VLRDVTRAADAAAAQPAAEPDPWRALRVRYDARGEAGRAQVDVAVRRVQISLTPEPLALLLAILEVGFGFRVLGLGFRV